jgi:hypothetical protein
MSGRKLAGSALVAAVGLVAVVMAAEPGKDQKTGGAAGEMQLPPGWTLEDMQACMAAGTPGKMHEHLLKGVGVWEGKSKMWMVPGSPPVESTCTSTVTSMMDGRYVKVEMAGEMPGMGPYNGLGIYGFDNVAGRFASTWVDNHSTGLMNGTGELSSDGKVLTWNFTFHCPLTKKPAVMREVETITGEGTKTLEMFGPDPKSGKEYQVMRIEFTKKA